MTLDELQSILNKMTNCDTWSIQLLRIKTSKRAGTSYASTSIKLEPPGKLTDFVKTILQKCTDNIDNEIGTYARLREYDGTTDADTIYTLNINASLISEEYNAFIDALTDPEEEADPLCQTAQAYVILGDYTVDGENWNIKFVSMQNPITILKHKFTMHKGAFKEINDKVLSLRPAIDVVILNDTVYFLTMAGEKLFHMERAYKAICAEKVAEIGQSGIVSDKDNFQQVAQSGHHPRMFVSFNEARYKALKKEKERKQYAKMFGIPLTNGKFDTSQKSTADKLVRLLCNKGMMDPFQQQPVEVSGARKWQ